MTNAAVFFSTSSLLLSVFGLTVTWFSWRRRELRREEVLRWADDCIEALQTLALISALKRPLVSDEKLQDIRFKVMLDTSILVERGRLFLKMKSAIVLASKSPKLIRDIDQEFWTTWCLPTKLPKFGRKRQKKTRLTDQRSLKVAYEILSPWLRRKSVGQGRHRRKR